MGNTTISKNLINRTKYIDPGSGKVLSEGSDPMSTVRKFKDNPQPVEVEVKNDRMDKLEKDSSKCMKTGGS